MDSAKREIFKKESVFVDLTNKRDESPQKDLLDSNMYAPVLLLRKSNRIQYVDRFTIKMKQCKKKTTMYVKSSPIERKLLLFVLFHT